MQTPDLPTLRARTLDRGVNPVLYRTARLVLVPFFRLYFRLEGVGAERIPTRGAAIIAANHRSFLDPFVIGALARRPVYYMAKRELFEHPLQARLLSALGAFPVDRGAGDEQAMLTALALLERGECVLIFPEGTRMRRGPLGNPRRGIGRMALQSGAPVVPVAVIGTDRVRRGWRIRPCKVAVRCGRPLRYPLVERPSRRIALGVAERIWACVSLQWQWLGGEMPPARLAAAEQRERGGLRRRVIDKRAAERLGTGRREAGRRAA
ncbi:MAG TPA: lysophospholipid acyltransferase family protein [Solirubrobacteraceae bacterium]|jgi:1-acyl-sn-glycerol-3-phosphate acyltransferase|nr:lysophospholipid acyltransferase family protein [Solirubrobacteraceae bacterium]